MRSLVWIVLAACLAAATGCGGGNQEFLTEDRLAHGMVIILPGIEGESPWNHSIRDGLDAGGVHWALPIYSWGRPVPGIGLLLNEMDFVGNRLAGASIAQMIVDYQDSHPGRPVYLVGHSGGGGVAVFAAEAMPEGRKVDGLILLSASISSPYDLTKALGRCRNGIVNFYNPADTAVLGIGTTVMGNVDGVHGPAAGLEGFAKPQSTDPQAKRLAYGRVYQEMVNSSFGGEDPHMAATQESYVSSSVAPWILASQWPAR